MTKRYVRCALLLLLALGGGWPAAHGADRGGITGDPIGLDWVDARHSDYLDRVKRRIQERLTYPCAQDAGPSRCEPQNAQLIVEFGILGSGRLQYVDVVRSSGSQPHDDAAVAAIRAASPYPAMPPDLIKAGSTGLPIRSQFTYVVHTRPVPPQTTEQLPAPKAVPIVWLVIASLLVAALAVGCAVMLSRRRRSAEATSQSAQAMSLEMPGPARPIAEGDQGVIAHDVLISHGWHDDGERVRHGLTTPTARSYSHPELRGHRVNVAATGEWEHTTVPGMPARGATADELAQHLGAIHGTLSIADLHLPGRRKS